MKLAEALALRAEATCAELESLIRRINRTNASAPLGAGTITDAIARRDILKLRHSVITSDADAAAGRERGWNRQLRSELTFISAPEIQRTNWEVDLLDE